MYGSIIFQKKEKFLDSKLNDDDDSSRKQNQTNEKKNNIFFPKIK